MDNFVYWSGWVSLALGLFFTVISGLFAGGWLLKKGCDYLWKRMLSAYDLWVIARVVRQAEREGRMARKGRDTRVGWWF